MADVYIVGDNVNFTYDPQIAQYDTTFWRSVTGTPAISTTFLRFTSARAASFSQYRYGDIEFTLTIPAVPTASDVRAWGFSCPNLGNRGRIEFQIVDTVFSVVAYDNAGNVEISQAITWDAAWTATAVRYRIQWGKEGIKFLINDTVVAKGENRGNSVNPEVPDIAQALHIRNGNADNMDMTAIVVRNVQALT